MSKYSFKFRDRALEMDGYGYLMGIVNVTPDSFSDGGDFQAVDQAVAHGLELVRQGADFLDVGGESTRPGHQPVSNEEEIRRVVPVIRELRRQTDIPLSVDTMKAEVAEAAFRAGADILNDVTGFDREREEKCSLAKRYGAGCILMHWRQRPEDVSDENYVSWACDCLKDSVCDCMVRSGLDTGHFMTDPGIGFGKTDDENLRFLCGLGQLREQGWPVLLGISRKSFIGRILDCEEPKRRNWGTGGATAVGAWLGVDVHRVHEVGPMRDVVRVAEAIRRVNESSVSLRRK